MELVLKDYPSEVELGASMASFKMAMESQKDLFHSQIDHLRNIVVTQCKLTGVNPLSQEMAAGALSIKIGKRPRDLLNPKAVKYMQAVFSIKDAISKKESREIGALFGLNVTQVREYFASQRTRVRKIVRISREKAVRASETKGLEYGVTTTQELHDGVSATRELQDGVSTNHELQGSVSSAQELQDGVPAVGDPILLFEEPVPLQSILPPTAEEAPSCSNQDEVLPGLDEFDKHFVENIFSSMSKEESFSGQVKLMEWILRVENPSVLSWFLSKDGVMILDSWLNQAVSEEQTSVLSVVLKVLCHLPLNKALPVHMSVILQGVNKLRFYRVAGISNRARVLLSKWSKMFAKSQALKKHNGSMTPGSMQEIDLRQRLDELMGDVSWQSSLDNPEGILVPYAGPDDIRNQEEIKLLTASTDDSNRKNILGTSSAYTKDRRKVQLVEQPGQKTSKSTLVKTTPVSQARPITADEIQKAKMRAHYMQSSKTKSDGPKKLSLLTNDFLSASEAYLRPKLEAQKKARLLPPKNIKQEESPCNPKSIVDPTPVIDPAAVIDSKPIVEPEPIADLKPNFDQKPDADLKPIFDQTPIIDQKESLLDKCRRVQIPWREPAEAQLNSDWGVGTGENGKETEFQKNRTRREKETFYGTIQEVPPNPKEPWDTEMDYDDTLTPEIPIEQLPETDNTDTPSGTQVPETQNSSVPSGSGAEPDLELLAVLLKNPELVFALTSGQASGLSSEDTVKLLDMLKSSGGLAMLNGQTGKTEKEAPPRLPSPTPIPTRDVRVSLPSPTPPSRIEVSLPSPTPTTNNGPSGWTLEPAKNPFSRQTHSGVVASQFTLPTAIPPLSHLSSQPPISFPGSSSFVSEYQSTMYANHDVNQTPPTNYLHINPYSEYQVPEDSNLRMTNTKHHDLADNSLSSSTHGSQSVYNPVSRNGFHRGGQSGGYEAWSSENSHDPAMYAPPEQFHGHEWRYPDQRFGHGHGPSLDRQSRNQNGSGIHDRNWQGGSGDRRWYGSDRRR